MDDKARARLKDIPKTRCAVCHSAISYMNPMAKCYECKRKFCFDHIIAGQWKKGMDDNEEVRDVCEECRLIKNYHSLSDADR